MITLKNNFHNTSVRIRANVGDTLTPSQTARARRVLCGSPDCKCDKVPTCQADDNGRMFWIDLEPYGTSRDQWVYATQYAV